MKSIYKAILLPLITVTLASCSEELDLSYVNTDTTYLAVECVLTDFPLMPQVVTLTESVDYFGTDSINLVAPPVSGASVTISDGEKTYQFKEKEDKDKGTYYAPTGFYAHPGKTYNLHIELDDPEKGYREYNATSTMISSGCRLDAVDYKVTHEVADSTYTIGIWGEVFDQESYLLAVPFINSAIFPLSSCFGLENKYYRGKYLDGFPIVVHLAQQSSYDLGRAWKKPFEEGDILGVGILSLTPEFYDYFMAYYYNNKSSSIPFLASQPANIASNIEGEDVVGFFATVPVQVKTRTIIDTTRKEYEYGNNQ